MLQQIITILILTIVGLFTIRHYYRRFQAARQPEQDPCTGCSSGCGGCPVMEIKEKIQGNSINQVESGS
ncbi:MAG: hypothetical protein KA053_07445 [Lentimicrobiaceae bacterium]|nr:hypothetical protein [Lentimicrobiaceae bacterium]